MSPDLLISCSTLPAVLRTIRKRAKGGHYTHVETVLDDGLRVSAPLSMKRHIAPLETASARLRLLEERDLTLTRLWRNQDHIRRWFLTSDPITPEQHQAWFRRYQDRDDDFVFVIEETDVLKCPVGQVSVYNVDWKQGSAEFGRLMLGEEQARRRGLARQVTRRLIDEAFGPWGLRELHLECLRENHRALAVYADCGFKVTGEGGPSTLMTIHHADWVAR